MKKIFFTLLILISSSSILFSQSPEEKGLLIAKSYKKANTGFKDFQASVEMIINSRGSQKKQMYFQLKVLETNGGDKSLFKFNRPKSVKGTAFLSFTQRIGEDEQWIFLPSLKRVKRISSPNKSASFMGSGLSYEDLNSFELEKFSYKFLRNEVFSNENFKVVRQVPQYENSGYKYIDVWYNTSKNIIGKMVFYDRKESLLKTLTYSNRRLFQNKFWKARMVSVENHQTGETTVLNFTNFRFNTGLTNKNFNKNSLRRSR